MSKTTTVLRFVQFHEITEKLYDELVDLYRWYQMKEDEEADFSEEREDDDGDSYTEDVSYPAICYVHPEYGFNAMKKEDLVYTTIEVEVEVDENNEPIWDIA